MTRWVLFFIVVSSLATGAAFLYSLKNVSADTRREVLQGAGFAVFVLSIGGFFIHKSVRFFEEQVAVDLVMKQFVCSCFLLRLRQRNSPVFVPYYSLCEARPD